MVQNQGRIQDNSFRGGCDFKKIIFREDDNLQGVGNFYKARDAHANLWWAFDVLSFRITILNLFWYIFAPFYTYLTLLSYITTSGWAWRLALGRTTPPPKVLRGWRVGPRPPPESAFVQHRSAGRYSIPYSTVHMVQIYKTTKPSRSLHVFR